MNWTLVFTSQAKKDAKKLASSGLKAEAQSLLDLLVELGRVRMNLSELAAHLGPGSIITLDTPTGAPLDVRVNNRLVARAEAIALGEKCGIRIVEIVGAGKDV